VGAEDLINFIGPFVFGKLWIPGNFREVNFIGLFT
jgi:hypothetical protein